MLLLSSYVWAGEIIVKVPDKELERFVRVMGFINRVFGQDVPTALDREKITLLADRILPLVSVGRLSKLSDIPAEIFVMKDEVIIQIPDAKLRERLDDAYKWCHVTRNTSENSRLYGAANAVLQVASFGRWELVTDVPAEISVRFDDKKYERE